MFTDASRIYVPGEVAKALLNLRLQREDQQKAQRGLMQYPQSQAEEQQQILGVASFLNQLQSPAVIRHPKFPVAISVTPESCPRQVLLFTLADHNQAYLELLHKHLQPGEVLLELGAGMGTGAILAMKQGAKKVVAYEPHPELFRCFKRNLEVNQVTVEAHQGCVVPGQSQGTTQFHLQDEAWASSIFSPGGEKPHLQVEVNVIDVAGLVKLHAPSMLALDIQGAELGLFNQIDLKPVKHLLVVCHTPLIGEKATADALASITAQGLMLKDMAGWAFYFSRGESN